MKALVQVARQALDAITARSELRELWAETPDYTAWSTDVAELRRRLSSA